MTAGPRVVSVRVGRVRELPRPDWDHHAERTWRTGYLKDEVAGPVRVGRLGMAGDEVADHHHHGGEQMAVLMYGERHYAEWRTQPGLDAMGPGAFGENLAVTGFDEWGVAIGDVLKVGEVEFEVSSPRAPCAAISRVWNQADLLARVVKSGRSGWYLRVRREGSLAAGDAVERLAHPHPEWTVARVSAARVAGPKARDEARALADLGALSPEWRELFARNAAAGD